MDFPFLWRAYNCTNSSATPVQKSDDDVWMISNFEWNGTMEFKHRRPIFERCWSLNGREWRKNSNMIKVLAVKPWILWNRHMMSTGMFPQLEQTAPAWSTLFKFKHWQSNIGALCSNVWMSNVRMTLNSNIGNQTSEPSALMFECRSAAVGCRSKSFSGCQGADKLVRLSDPFFMGGWF